jgi:hypothetical protein
LFYFGLVRLGLYEGFGFRYALIFTPIVVMVLVWVLVRLTKSPFAIVGWFLLVALLSVELYAVPHPTFSRLLRNEKAWSPQEDLQLAFDYWQEQRLTDEATYVYYGAVPAMRYYLRLSGLDTTPIEDARAIVECSAEKGLPVCRENQVYFSRWVRALTTEEKIADMFTTMGTMPQRVWLLFSHTHQDEAEDMMAQLQNQYEIIDQFQEGEPATASAYLLQRKVP